MSAAGTAPETHPTSTLARHYEQLAERFPETATGDYATLVVPTGNSEEPVHRWFHLKEAFSFQLLSRVLKDTGLSELADLDVFEPFAGSGTVVASLSQLVADEQISFAQYLGLEANPFLHLLASTKGAVAQAPPSDFLERATQVVEASRTTDLSGLRPPSLATFNETYFPRSNLNALLRLKSAIAKSNVTGTSRSLLDICLAATVEPASCLRKDGRALRRVATPRTNDPTQWFLALAKKIWEDIPQHSAAITGAPLHGDIRQFELPVARMGASDLSVFSPPYPNNIDYTEVYKLEAWFLGLISTQSQFRDQRRASLRSHGSLKWADDYAYFRSPHRAAIESLISPLLSAIPSDRYETARRQLVMGYVDDMFSTLKIVSASLRPGGKMVCVVGNSLHGAGNHPVLIAADLIIATLAELVHLKVDRLEVARVPTRRSTVSRFLRESVIFATRTETGDSKGRIKEDAGTEDEASRIIENREAHR